MKTILLFAFSFLALTRSVLGVTLLLEIDSPAKCPENLRIETRLSRGNAGLVSVTVRCAPTAPESYRGRVKAFVELRVKSGDKTNAVANLESTQRRDVFEFSFRLGRDAFRDSELTITSVLYEKDGTATVGGGEVYRVRLNGFAAGEQPVAEPNAAP